jgi:hypothetical protein
VLISSVLKTPVTVYCIGFAVAAISTVNVVSLDIEKVFVISKLTVTVLPKIPAVVVSAIEAEPVIPVGRLPILTSDADITNPVFGVIVKIALETAPICSLQFYRVSYTTTDCTIC